MISVQADFSNYFDMVQSKATTSKFYTDIQKFFKEGKIDAKTYASIMTEYHASTLRESIDTARSMSIGIRELELKTNESVANVALTARRTTAIGEEIAIKQAESNSSIAVNTERIEGMKKEKALTDKKIIQLDREYNIAQADANIRVSESAKNIELITARKELIYRQKNGFDDNKKIKKAEHASNLYGMIESGGAEAPQELVNLVMSSLGNI